MKVAIPMPYGLKEEDLKIDPIAEGMTADEAMGWITDNVPWESDELTRILTAAIGLWYHLGLENFGACLHTAILWERG